MLGFKTVLVSTLLACTLSLQTRNAQDEMKERPIAKVINMLKDMTATLEKEAETDAEMYEQMGCWCETGDKQKAAAIQMADQHIKDLNAAIGEYTAKSAQLTSDIETLETQVAEQTNSLNEATGIRDKELGEFNAEDKDMIQSITSLKGAVITMSKAHGESALIQVNQLLKRQSKKYGLSNRKLSLIQERTSDKSMERTPASGEIFGMLKQMKESFETNLATGRKEEEQGATEYAQMKEAKTAEINAAKSQTDSKTVQLADSDNNHALAQQDLKDTTASMEADIEFLADLKGKCAVADQEYDARVKVRNEEKQAVSETMGILTSDEANDSFTKSMSFFQKSDSRKSSIRERAAALLKRAAEKSRNPRLVTLAMSMRLDAFGKVIENIGNMVAALKQEQQDEVKDRDFCVKELNTNERQAAAAHDKKGDLDTKIADLSSSIAELTEALAALSSEVTSTQVEMKKANEMREKENADFSMTIQDQRATQAILKKALDRLKDFYAKKALLQEDANGEPLAPPPAQAAYKPSGGAGGVMAMIEDVVKDSVAQENQAIADENNAQAAYEGFIKDSNKLINANNADIADKSDAKAKDDAALAEAKGDLKGTIDTILSLGDMATGIHDQCDFLLKNFGERQSSRTQEMDALNQAKAIFSGMK